MVLCVGVGVYIRCPNTRHQRRKNNSFCELWSHSSANLSPLIGTTEQHFSRMDILTRWQETFRIMPLSSAALTPTFHFLGSSFTCSFLSFLISLPVNVSTSFWRMFSAWSNKDQSTCVLRHSAPLKGRACALFRTWVIFILTLALKEHSLVLESPSLTTASRVGSPAKKSACPKSLT